ncbi:MULTISPECIES: hypothetical protein [unclassified Parabacteroides]|uniref:hypothetical protein n=1 Tax=unclassified Parabacteroides TaxID=2649774 RepID=UPI0011C3A002|nr:hypothetical protein [Parabacteroides sp. TM07-1AC]
MNEMKATGNILSIRVDIPQSEFSIFEFLAQKMGWKIRSEKEDTEKKELEEEKKQFFANSKRSMAKQIEKYLSE